MAELDVEVVFDEDTDGGTSPKKKAKRRVRGDQPTAKAADAPLSIHLYKHFDNTERWLAKKWVWEELPDKLLTVGRLAMESGKIKDKTDLPLWSPVTTLDDIPRRRKGDIETVGMLALDFDCKVGRAPTIDEVYELFSSWDGWAHTSWSHTEKQPRVRVVLRIDGDIVPQHYYRIWHWAERRCASAGLVIDPSRKNANSVWFAPVRKAGFEEKRWSGRDGALPTQLILTGAMKREELGGEAFDPVEEDLIIDHEEGRTSIAMWAGTAKAGDKLKCACPFVKDATMGSAFLRKRAAGVLIICTSPNHGHPTPYMRWWHDPRAGGTVRSPDRALVDRLDWKLDKDGRRQSMKPTLNNVQLILTEDPRWVGRLWFDIFADCKRIDDRRWMGKEEAWGVKLWVEQVYGIEAPIDIVNGACALVMNGRRRDPLLEDLDKLKWDKTKRISGWLQRAFGVPDDQLHRDIGRKFLVQLIARAYRPGCKADYVLVLVGDQGDGKGKALKALAGDGRFSDTLLDVKHKDAYQQLKGVWLYEFAELASIRGHATIEQIKSYLTSSTDTYRKSYGEDSMPHPRRTVFVGTTNEETFLYDMTGNRRYWPVAITKADDIWVAENREQLLAEAVVAFKAGEEHFFAREEEKSVAAHTSRFEVREAYTEPVEAWLRGTGLKVVTVRDLLGHALELRPHQFDRATETRVGHVMVRELGWKKARVQGKLAVRVSYFYHHPDLTSAEALKLVRTRIEAAPVGSLIDVVFPTDDDVN